MANIFLNYRREDSGGYARVVYERLAGRYGADRVFRDLDAIPAGADYVDRIATALDQCDTAIVLIGERWSTLTDARGRRRLDVPGDLVTQEIAEGLARRIRVIPVLLPGARMPEAEDLPASIKALARHNALELSDSRLDYDIGRLFDAIGPSASTATVSPANRRPPVLPPPTTAEAPHRRSPLVGPLVALCLLVLVAGGALGAVTLLRHGGSTAGASPGPSTPVTTSPGSSTPVTTSRPGPTTTKTSVVSTTPRLALNPSAGRGGSTAQSTATGFQPGEVVQVFFQGQLVAQSNADSSGAATAPFTVPPGLGVFVGQTMTVSAAGKTSVRSADALFTIRA